MLQTACDDDPIQGKQWHNEADPQTGTGQDRPSTERDEHRSCQSLGELGTKSSNNNNNCYKS